MLLGMRLAERVVLFRELATLVDSGMSLGMSLSTLEERHSSLEQRIAVHDAATKVSRGKRFSDVMREHPRVFNELNAAMVAAGEEGGSLDTMLNKCADYLEHDLEFQQTISRETFYPKILALAIIFIPLGTKVLVTSITASPMAGFWVGAKALLMMVFFGVVPIYLLYQVYRRYYATEQGRLAIDRLKLRLPVIGTIITKMAWTRMSRALAALYGAGVNIRTAVTIASRTAGNAALELALQATVPALERGEKLSDALAKTGMVPPLAMSMLRTGEHTGGIDATMEKVGQYFEAEARTTLRKLTVMIVPVCVIVGAVAVFFQLAAMYTGMYAGPLLNQ